MDLVEQRFPYQCITRYPYPEVQQWCLDNVGEFDITWYRYGQDILAGVFGKEIVNTYRFLHEKDAVAFTLKWG